MRGIDANVGRRTTGATGAAVAGNGELDSSARLPGSSSVGPQIWRVPVAEEPASEVLVEEVLVEEVLVEEISIDGMCGVY